MYFVLTSLLLFYFSIDLESQQTDYEGELMLETTKSNIKTNYFIKFKNEHIKIDFIDKNGNNTNSLLINTHKNSILELNNIRKNFRIVNPNSITLSQKKCSFQKKSNVKQFLHEYDCEEWTAFNEENKTRVEYVIANNTDFFHLQKVLKYIDKKNLIFSTLEHLPISKNVFLFSAIAYNKSGQVISQTSLSKLKKTSIPDSTFEVPENYKSW